ncbi:transcriptional regulator, PadR-like family protein [Natrialba aegyptia DSM 13077]|uniref:Transcriptional regulator, PadR-like family protein n=1 Tax=Natrialba aegyptia DSM 13077 TaxID=1227491 RepID=M0AQD0_9EURY|nr:transcriptional regulator, PadR-like family protein [Natrialba aegyptia DSM 13077]
MYDLTGFQRDLLYVIAGQDVPHGLAIKDELEAHYETEINHGRLYPNLDTLVDKGLVEKGQKDRRTNVYSASRRGTREIETLDRSYNFSDEQMNQLSEFDIGQRMILYGGEAYWPIELWGAPCGIGLGDRHWLDRYGQAWGPCSRDRVRRVGRQARRRWVLG